MAWPSRSGLRRWAVSARRGSGAGHPGPRGRDPTFRPRTPPPEGAPHRPPRLARPHAVPVAEPGCVLPSPAGVEDFWAGIRRRGTPLIAPDPEGSTEYAVVTYLWRGAPGTRAVQVLPTKLGDPLAPEGNLMTRGPRYRRLALVGPSAPRLARHLRLPRRRRGRPGAGRPRVLAVAAHPARADPYNVLALPRRWGGDPVPYAALPGAPDAVDWEPRRRSHAAR